MNEQNLGKDRPGSVRALYTSATLDPALDRLATAMAELHRDGLKAARVAQLCQLCQRSR